MNKSESIANLAKALAAFQAEVSNPKNIADNPFFKSEYAPLDEVLRVVRPLLAKNGLSVLQFPSADGEHVSITTIIMHSSGEWLEADQLKMRPVKNDPQAIGSAITYARRYSLCAVLGIVGESDDDGNEASHPQHSQETPRPASEMQFKHPQETPQPASEMQLRKIFVVARELGMTPGSLKELLKQEYDVESSKQLTKRQASDVITHLEQLKQSKMTEGETK